MKKILVLTLLLISAGLQAQWDNIYTHDEPIYAVDAVTPDTVYVAGLRCAIRSLDGGQSWEDLNYNFENFVTLDIDFPTSETGYLLGWYGVLKTPDFGETWKMVAPDSIEYFKASFVSADTGWIIGKSRETYDGVVIRTYDGGENWDYYSMGFDFGIKLTDLQMINSKTGYITHADMFTGIFKTVDGGNEWTELNTNEIEGYITCCSFINQDTGYVGTNGIYRTEDGGNQWTFLTSQNISGFYSATLQFLNYDTGYYAGYFPGWEGELCTSSDAGNTWMRRTGKYIDVDMVNNDVGYTIESTGEIYKTTEGGLYVDVEEQKVTDGKLLFPNPFSDEITLDLTALIPANEEPTFTLFSVNGRKIMHKKVNSSGKQIINTFHLKKGIYIYKICSGSEVINNGKLIKH